MPEPDKNLAKEIAELTGVAPEVADAEARLAQELEETWIALPFQPIRAVLALIFIAGGFGLYDYILLSFWSSPTWGFTTEFPTPAYFGIGAAMLLALIGVRLAIGVWSPARRSPSVCSRSSHVRRSESAVADSPTTRFAAL